MTTTSTGRTSTSSIYPLSTVAQGILPPARPGQLATAGPSAGFDVSKCPMVPAFLMDAETRARYIG